MVGSADTVERDYDAVGVGIREQPQRLPDGVGARPRLQTELEGGGGGGEVVSEVCSKRLSHEPSQDRAGDDAANTARTFPQRGEPTEPQGTNDLFGNVGFRESLGEGGETRPCVLVVEQHPQMLAAHTREVARGPAAG